MGNVSRGSAGAVIAVGVLGTGGACWLALLGIEPFATWLYPFAWYPLLLAVEGAVALRRKRFVLLGRPRALLSVLAWSVPLWMLWELLNFRLENWYYVFVPEWRAALWTGVVLSFATVLPACFLPAALVWPRKGAEPGAGGSAGTGSRAPSGTPAAPTREVGAPSHVAGAEPPALSDGALLGIRLAGAAMLALPVVWPRLFFPLVWGGFVLLLEPDLLRGAPSRSLLADVLEGRHDRIGALLLGGALAGLAWEALNVVARGSWIYTVPGLEELKLFEMPLLGFFGFPPLALSCFTLYQWLALRGWAVPLGLEPGREPERDGSGEGPDGSGWWVRIAAVGLVVASLLGMEAWTISSRTPRLRDLPGLLPSDVETLGAWGVDSPFALADADPGELARQVPGVEAAEARIWVEGARLATTRGMGTRNARLLRSWGVSSLEELARTGPDELASCFGAVPGAQVRPAQVRVWWRTAVRVTGGGGEADRTPEC